ncbi:MAG: hypothetical protein Q8O56_11895 [Solirubrobacteraceae bacterium]|nr:hypothetical protein [Solirubrobacteraceae bacterium]
MTQAITNDTAGGVPNAPGGAPAPLIPAPAQPGMVTVREDMLASAALAVGFVAGAGGVGAAVGMPFRAVGLGRRTPPALKGMRMRNRKLNAQLAPAMYSLAATNSQLLGLVGSRRPVLALAKLGVAAAAVAYVTADEATRKQMLDQATGLLEQGAGALSSSGLLDKVFK